MKILIDASPIAFNTKHRTGLARYSYDLVQGIIEQGQSVGVNASGSLMATEDLNKVAVQEGWTYAGKRLPKRLPNSELVKKVFNYTRSTITKDIGAHYDIYHSTYARIRKDVRTYFPNRHVLTVHDLTPLKFPTKYFHSGQLAITKRIIESIQKEDWVITVSENTRNDLIDFTKINPERVKTVYNGYDESLFFNVKDQALIAKGLKVCSIDPDIPFLLTLSALGPHKNLKTLIASVALMDKEQPNLNFKLVIVGKSNAHIQSLLKHYEARFTEKRIVLAGFIEDVYLAPLYSACTAFVFPSLYEGFGYPLLEAMACGAPIVYSNSSSLPEIAGNCGFGCDPLSKEEFSEKLLRLLNDANLCRSQSNLSIERAKVFSLKSSIENTINVYNTIIHQ